MTLSGIIEFLIQHGYAVLFAWVLVEQMGLPLPATPLLFAAGALAGEGQLNPALAFGLAVVAALISNVLWYQIGRRGGSSVLALLCRISLNPDSCVRRASDIFARHGVRSLLVAKFIPGLGHVAPPLAGIFRMSLWRFLLFNGLGTCFWVFLFAGLGYLFSDQVEQIALYTLRLGASLMIVIGGGLGAFILWKYIQRRRFLHQLRFARIAPEELKQKLDAGENLVILDVRHPLQFKAEPQTIPGAIHLPLEQLDQSSRTFPSDREVVLYCN
jgi:membrane protein DedA with SNARE-associated domain